MATLIGTGNVKNVEDNLDSIQTSVDEWSDYPDSLNSVLNSDVGVIFREGFTIGDTQTTKILKLIDILIEMQGTIRTLIQDSYDFCEKIRAADNSDN